MRNIYIHLRILFTGRKDRAWSMILNIPEGERFIGILCKICMVKMWGERVIYQSVDLLLFLIPQS